MKRFSFFHKKLLKKNSKRETRNGVGVTLSETNRADIFVRQDQA